MKKYRFLLAVSAMLVIFCCSAVFVSAETTYTWQCTYSTTSGIQEDGYQVMHTTVNDTHADGETNYADIYCALQIPPDSFPADKELALGFKLYGNVIRNDNNRGIFASCDVTVGKPGLDRSDALNEYSMSPDDYDALRWGNYTNGGFSDRSTVVRYTLGSYGCKAGEMRSIYLITNFGMCEWRYKLVKSGSDSSSAAASGVEYVMKGKNAYAVKNNKAEFFYNKDENATKVTIPATIKYKGKKIPVTSIDSLAFNKHKKLKTVIIGKNVKKIEKKAFYGFSKLRNITIRTKKLTAKSIGANAFKGISRKAVVKCPKSKKKAYKKILLKKGMKKTVKFRNL